MPPAVVRTFSALTNRLVSASASIVALAALGTSLYEARLNREQQRASVWPYVTQANSGEGRRFSRIIVNDGLGPALVKSFQVWVSGDTARPDSLRTYHPVHHWGDVIDSLHIPVPPGTYSYSSTVRRGVVIRAGETIEVYTMPDTLVARAFPGHFGGADFRICYCSLYGDCWTQRSHEIEPREVKACADQPALEFEQ